MNWLGPVRQCRTAIPAILKWPVSAYWQPFALYVIFLAIDPWLGSLFPDMDFRWSYGFRIAAPLGALAFYLRVYGELQTASAELGDWLWALLLGILVFLVWINLDSGWAVVGNATDGFIPVGAGGRLLWPLVVLRLFGAALVVPIIEELFWRSFLQRWIDQSDFLALAPGAGSQRAHFLTSLAFGLEHNEWLAGILAGLAYGWLYRRSGRLWVPIAAHALTNLLLGIWVVGNGAWKFW